MKDGFKVAALILAVMAFLVNPAFGQNSEKKGWIQGFFGGGMAHSDYGSDEFMHAGAGGGILIAGGLGGEAEIGFMHFPGSTDNGTLFSAGAIYAFNTDQKTLPFLTGGYVGFLGDDTSSGGYFGGGVMHFFGDRLGIRLEVRDQIYSDDWGGGTFHYLEARGGIAFGWD